MVVRRWDPVVGQGHHHHPHHPHPRCRRRHLCHRLPPRDGRWSHPHQHHPGHMITVFKK